MRGADVNPMPMMMEPDRSAMKIRESMKTSGNNLVHLQTYIVHVYQFRKGDRAKTSCLDVRLAEPIPARLALDCLCTVEFDLAGFST